jgi:hypothetical protein
MLDREQISHLSAFRRVQSNRDYNPSILLLEGKFVGQLSWCDPSSGERLHLGVSLAQRHSRRAAIYQDAVASPPFLSTFSRNN